MTDMDQAATEFYLTPEILRGRPVGPGHAIRPYRCLALNYRLAFYGDTELTDFDQIKAIFAALSHDDLFIRLFARIALLA